MWKKLVIVGLSAVAVTGCSSSAKSSSSSSSGGAGNAPAAKGYKACSILSGDLASKILGAPVTTGTDEKAAGIPYPSCAYSATSGSIVTVGLTIFNTAATADTLLATYTSQYQGLTPLSGVGDQALQESDGKLVVAVHNHVGCAMLRTGDLQGGADDSTKALADVCKAVFAAG